MASYFAGGTAGSALAATLYASLGWWAVAAFGVAIAAAALALWLSERLAPSPARTAAALR